MSYVYVATRNTEDGVINELYVDSTEDGIVKKLLPCFKGAVVSFIEDNIDERENVVDMLYSDDERGDEFNEKVASLKGLSVDEIVKSLSPKELLTIYGNIYKEEENIFVSGYDKNGNQEAVVLSNKN
jgi:hypothetical protein